MKKNNKLVFFLHLKKYKTKIIIWTILLVIVIVGFIIAHFKLTKMEPITKWERLNNGLIDVGIKNIILTTQPSTIYVQTEHSFLKSTNNGSSWLEINTLPGDIKDVFITSYENSFTGERSDTLWLGSTTSLGKDEEGQRIIISPLFSSDDGARTWKEVTISCVTKYDTSINNHMKIEGILFDDWGNIYLQYYRFSKVLDAEKPFMMLLTKSENYEYDYDCRGIGTNVFSNKDKMPNIYIGGFGKLAQPGFFGFFNDWNDTYAVSVENIYYNQENSDKWGKIQKPSDKFYFSTATNSTNDLLVAGNDKDRKSMDNKIGDKVFLKKSKSNSWENITGNLPEVYINNIRSYNISKRNNLYKRIFVIGKSFYNINKKTNNKRRSGEIYIVTTDINIDNIPKSIKWDDITGDLNETLRVADITDAEIQGKVILLGTKEQGIIRGVLYKKNKLKL